MAHSGAHRHPGASSALATKKAEGGGGGASLDSVTPGITDKKTILERKIHPLAPSLPESKGGKGL